MKLLKRIFAIVALMILTTVGMSAKDKVYRDTSPLPDAAKTMLKTYFPKVGVSHVKVDTELFSKDYEVVLNDGTEVDFDKNGNWENVDCGHKAVPSGLILKSISKYVASNYKGAIIVKVDKDRHGYEIDLSNGLELKFDRSGKFLRVDD